VGLGAMRRSPSQSPAATVRSGVQHRELPATAGPAAARQALDLDHTAGKADQDRCEHGSPLEVCKAPTGRGGGSLETVRRHPGTHPATPLRQGCLGAFRMTCQAAHSLSLSDDPRVQKDRADSPTLEHRRKGLAGSLRPSEAQNGQKWDTRGTSGRDTMANTARRRNRARSLGKSRVNKSHWILSTEMLALGHRFGPTFHFFEGGRNLSRGAHAT
jgi:hypothetical protein